MADSSQGTVFRRLFVLAMPIIGLNVLGVLALAVDTAMCGRLPNAEQALTALGFASQIVFLLMVAMLGLTVGVVAFVARAYGAKETERVNHILHQGVLLTYLVSLFVAVVGNVFAATIMGWLGADADIVRLGVDYLRPLLTFTIFYYLNILIAAALRGVGNTSLPFVVALLTNAINIVLNYGLIFGRFGLPAMGVRGAAWGTVVAQAISVLLLVLVLRRGFIKDVRIRMGWTRIDRPLVRELMRVGAPAALDMVVLNISFLTIVGMLGRIEQVAVAAHGIGLRIQSLSFVPGLAISQATGAMVGNALGARNSDEARQVTRAGVLLSTSVMSSLGLSIIYGTDAILRVFDVPEGTALFDYASTWMRILGWGMPVVGVHIGFVGMLRGAGATNTSLAINVIGTMLVQIPLSWAFGFLMGWGAFGVWVAVPISFGVRMFFGFAAYRRGEWAQLDLRETRISVPPEAIS